MSDFTLHSRLAEDTAFIADWPLCRVLLMNDARFPWLVLVPRVAGACEIFDLDELARGLAIAETARAGVGLKRWTEAEKINIGALGNIVPQLHIHVIARKVGDAAWPRPVWGAGAAKPYEDLNRAALNMREAF